MEKIITTIVTYKAADGIEFETEDECRTYESLFNIPNGIILLDRDGKLITEINGFTATSIDIAYLPTSEAIEWFKGFNNYYGFSNAGLLTAGKHYHYVYADNGQDYWGSYEDDIRDAETLIKKIDILRNLKSF